MIQISQMKLPVKHTEEELKKAIAKVLKSKEDFSYQIVKKSLDARKKEDLKYIYSVHVQIKEEEKVIKQAKSKNVELAKETRYEFPQKGNVVMNHRPVIVGAGPAGLFCGLMLAKEGYRPIVLERGESVDERVKTIEAYWETKQLNTESNVQFGEGGAGTFSDGKLNTGVKDKWGRNKEVLKTFVKYGAPEEILYWNKPHIGTDLLRDVVKNMRKDMIALGGEVRFSSKVTDICLEEDKKEMTAQKKMPLEQFLELQKEMEESEAKQAVLEKKQHHIKAVCMNGTEWLPCEVLVIAIGHSARDTFSMLYEKQLFMTKKSFAIGLRVEHPRDMINRSQYGKDYDEYCLPTADYKLVHHVNNGRSVYSFCMCPGGFVVNSSSEEGRIVVNGMSNYKRDAKNSNTAIVVNVTPEDFFEDSPLSGVEFQRKWESLAYEVGGNDGSVPIQLFGDFEKNQVSTKLGEIEPSLQGQYSFGNLRECLPTYVSEAICEGMYAFDKKIKGYGRSDTIFTGVETRTSSPIRMERDKQFISNIGGIYPCGEGAGYAGGITSAAIDGIKVAEAIGSYYKPFEKEEK